MQEIFFENAEEFANIFGLEEEPKHYLKYQVLSDRKVGFSVQRDYPEDIRYIPPKTKENIPDTLALIHVNYLHPFEAKEKVDPNKVPLLISINPYSRYLANHHDYDFTDNDCPTLESIEKSKNTTKPISLDFYNDYFYNHGKNTIINREGDIQTGKQVLDYVFQRHCDTVHLWKGFKLRFQIFLHNKSTSYYFAIEKVIIDLLIWTLKTPFGRRLEPKDPIHSVLGGYSENDLKTLNTDTINIFGYKASKNVIVTFCFIVFCGYTFFYYAGVKHNFLKIMFSNGFLSITNGILFLATLEYLGPKIIFWILNLLIRRRSKMIFKTFKF